MRDDGVLAEPMSLQVLPSNDFTGPGAHGNFTEEGNGAVHAEKSEWKLLKKIA